MKATAVPDLDQQRRPRDRSRGGRPSRYTASTTMAILAALFGGATRSEAARHAGVAPSTFYEWLRLGREGHPGFVPLADAVGNVEHRRGAWKSFASETRKRSLWKAFR